MITPPFKFSETMIESLKKNILEVATQPPAICPNGFVSSRQVLGYDSQSEPKDFLNEELLVQVLICQEWLQDAKPRKTANQNFSSYGIKHLIERTYNTYVCNGALLVACRLLNVRLWRIDSGPNAFLPIDESWYRQESKQRKSQGLPLWSHEDFIQRDRLPNHQC